MNFQGIFVVEVGGMSQSWVHMGPLHEKNRTKISCYGPPPLSSMLWSIISIVATVHMKSKVVMYLYISSVGTLQYIRPVLSPYLPQVVREWIDAIFWARSFLWMRVPEQTVRGLSGGLSTISMNVCYALIYYCFYIHIITLNIHNFASLRTSRKYPGSCSFFLLDRK